MSMLATKNAQTQDFLAVLTQCCMCALAKSTHSSKKHELCAKIAVYSGKYHKISKLVAIFTQFLKNDILIVFLLI